MVATEQMTGSDGGVSEKKTGALAGVRQEARRATAGIRTTVQEEIQGRMSQVGQQISSGASDLRGLGDKLQEQGREGVAHLAYEAATKAEKVAGYFTDLDAEQMWAKVSETARRQPWLVVGGFFAAGMLVARLVKASAQEEEGA